MLQSGLVVRPPCSDTHSCPRHQGLGLDSPEGCDVAQGGEKGSAFGTKAVLGHLDMKNYNANIAGVSY